MQANTTMNFQIRPYKESDFERTVDLMSSLQDYFSEIDISDEMKPFVSQDEATAYIEQAVKDVETRQGANFVAEVDGRVIGFIQGIITTYEGDVLHSLGHKPRKDGWIGLLFTEKNHRGKGIGQALINRIREYFVENKCSAIKLFVASENKRAIKMYEKYGFTPTNLEMTLKIE